MIRLVYLSAAQPTIRQSDLDEILASSRRNNAAAGVTGILLYGRGSFIQVLEGKAESVEERFAHIRNDKRHSAILTVMKSPIGGRDFPHWSMGYRTIRGTEREVEGLINLRDASNEIISAAGSVSAFLNSFREANIDAA